MHVIDSHTGGMPTRVILDGGPDLGAGTIAERALRLATDHKDFYQSVLLEPRGQPGMVGALLVPSDNTDCATGVIYFDACAVLGMCGHGTIGLGVTLAHLGRIQKGKHLIETPAGIVSMDLIDPNRVQLTNIESRRIRASVCLHIPEYGKVTGDLAYGGNWFFIVDPSPIAVDPKNIRELTEFSIAVREACIANNITGEHGEHVDHVVLQGPSPVKGVRNRNFVLCPDDDYDRSPCGTGSSAWLACLAAWGELPPGAEIVQESIIGSPYWLSYQPGPNGGIIPNLKGQAFVMAESQIMFAENDPFRGGIVL